MTKEDIIKLAREVESEVGFQWCVNFIELERFANLVAAVERKACETAVEDMARKYQKAHEASAENVADACAYAIRARGVKHG